MAGTDKSKII